MKRSSPVFTLSLISLFFFFNQGQAQEPATQTGRPRTVTSVAQTPQQPNPPRNGGQQIPADANRPSSISTQSTPAVATTEEVDSTGSQTKLFLNPETILARKSEAQRLLKSRPLTTALTPPSIEFVTVAALDRATSRTHLITLSKETFLTRGAEVTLTSSLGTLLNVRILRANGVNTALTIFDPNGQSLVPLLVEFPIEKGGLFREMAYYTSAHPALLSRSLAYSGQSYIRNMLDLAAKRLREKGAFISPDIVNVAERLCIVEHVDHDRFRQENRLALYDEIYSLYALNEVDTYRYSVSVAGAGGMVQMIPWAYNLERQRHPGAGLTPDFVTGMRNHANALQAMLLYMQDTWNDLAANEDVKYALNAKIATTSEILAAGYNSNAAKLPSYIRRGGEDWKNLIPRETQMYLQIYKSFESLVPLKARTTVPTSTEN